MISIIGTPLGYLMFWCFELLGDYGLAILLFTLITKIILFPLSIIAQKNSIKMVRMQPTLREIKEGNQGNGALIMEETRALYKKEKYSTWKGILPLLVQIPIILGLINVIYNPLKHLLHMDSESIRLLVQRTSEVLNIPVDDLSYAAQLRVVEVVHKSPEAFSDLTNLQSQVEQIINIDTTFFGIDLSVIPSIGDVTIIMAILSALSALLLCLIQNKYNVLQVEQGFLGKWGMTVFLVIFSGYFAYVLPAGLGLYWTAGNLLSIPVLMLCNLIYSPKKYIDYENRSVKVKLTSAEKKAHKAKAKILRAREREDAKRFYSKDNSRQLVFYSESNGFYKYFAGIIEYILSNSNITIHYVTSDPNDSIFDKTNPQIKSYYIGNSALIGFMMKMDADIVVMTLPDLEIYHVKRSLVRKDVEYIYLDHGMASLHLMLREHALDHFDTVFCYGPNHIEEVRETEKAYALEPKTLVKTGYGLLDELLEKVSKMDIKNSSDKKQILIAPSWQKDNILDLCLHEIVDGLTKESMYKVIIRPHPEYVKRFPAKMQAIIDRYADICGDSFVIETDFSSNTSVYTSDIVITDWSTIAQEFSYATKKPSLFINTPMKIMNPEYKKIPSVPLEISMRDELGVSLDLNRLGEIDVVIKDLILKMDYYQDKITKLLNHNIYDIGHGSESGAGYIIARIEENEYLRNENQ